MSEPHATIVKKSIDEGVASVPPSVVSESGNSSDTDEASGVVMPLPPPLVSKPSVMPDFSEETSDANETYRSAAREAVNNILDDDEEGDVENPPVEQNEALPTSMHAPIIMGENHQEVAPLDETHALATNEAVSIALDEGDDAKEGKTEMITQTLTDEEMEKEKEKVNRGFAKLGEAAVAVSGMPASKKDDADGHSEIPNVFHVTEDVAADKKGDIEENMAVAMERSRNPGLEDDVPPPPLSRMEDLSRQTSTPGAYAVPGHDDSSDLIFPPPPRSSSDAVETTHTATDSHLVSAELVVSANDRGGGHNLNLASQSGEDDPEGNPVSAQSAILTVEASPMDEYSQEENVTKSFKTLISNRRVRMILVVVAVLFVGLLVVIVLAVNGTIGSNSKTPIIEISDSGDSNDRPNRPPPNFGFKPSPSPTVSPTAQSTPTTDNVQNNIFEVDDNEQFPQNKAEDYEDDSSESSSGSGS